MRLLTEVEPARDGTDGAVTSSAAYVCQYSPEVKYPSGDPQNLYDTFRRAAESAPENPALGWRPIVNGTAQPYKWLTYKEAMERTANIGAALKALGVEPGSAIGMYASNSPEWMMSMKGVDYCGGISVPLYDTFGPDAIKFIIQHSGVKVIFAGSDKLATLCKVLPSVTGQVVQVVVWQSGDGPPAEEAVQMEAAEQCGIPVVSWQSTLAFGAANPADATPGQRESLCTIMYTSGTTGDPKGVEITHRAVLATVGALEALLVEMNLAVGSEDVFLSYLPLAHIFDRVAEEMFLHLAARIGYWQGSAKALMNDVAALQPTVFVGVPRIFDRIYSGVTDKVSSAGKVKELLFNAGFAVKQFFLNFGICNVPGIDDVLFKKTKEALGGHIKIIVSGGAPLAQHVESFLKATMCCPVTQGYGLTETCGASFIASPYDASQASTVGAPVAGLRVRLDSIPDMGYDAQATPPRGEVLLKGPGVFSAYHKRDDLCDEVLGKDGWFQTGDVGELLPSGALKIIDRKKNFFKLAHGEYVAAEKLENQFKKETLVDQIWVYGDSEKAALVAVVVPDQGSLTAWASEQGSMPTELAELCKDSRAAEHMQQRLEAAGRAAGLKGFEIVKKVTLFPEPFSTENDLLTPSFKLKRPQLKKRFADDIAAMYAALG